MRTSKIESASKTVQDVGQKASLVAENDRQVGFGASMLRKMADDSCRPMANGKNSAKGGGLTGDF